MEWSFDRDKEVWNLKDGNSDLARIFVKNKMEQSNSFTARVLISSIYCSKKKFKSLSKANKSWQSKYRKFKTEKAREDYVKLKKEEILKIIEQI